MESMGTSNGNRHKVLDKVANWGRSFIVLCWIMSSSGGVKPIAASWKWGPKPFRSSRPVLGEEIFGTDQNTDRLNHLLVFADDIFVFAHHWAQMTQNLLVLKRKLQDNHFQLAENKTQIVCTGG
eukprot:6469845-Amphidinium_carterae.1